MQFFTQPPTNSPQSYQSVRPTAEHASAEFHPRISELGQLAAYIALDLKTGKHPKAQRAQAHFETLERWHRTLPPPVRLSRLSLDDPSSFTWQTKRCLLQLHILFLGLFIEPHRDCLLDLAKYRLGTKTLDQGELNASKAVEEQCVLAARQSARVASLLQTSKLIRSRCWVSVYATLPG